MQARLTIGDFSRMTHLSVKALRHYHEIGLLEPADVDRDSGYRLYQPAQVPAAQVIRRFRDLGMPLEGIKEVLQAPDVDSRNRAVAAHLQRMERSLELTQATVASLRRLLEQPQPLPVSVDFRSIPATPSLAICERVSTSEVEGWWVAAFQDLHRAVVSSGAQRAGPDGALYPSEFFESEVGDVVAFVPVIGDARPFQRVQPFEVPAAELAVLLHKGPFGDLDRAYGALGTFVAERALGVEGPIREYYLVTPADTPDESQHQTEVAWPIFQTATKS